MFCVGYLELGEPDFASSMFDRQMLQTTQPFQVRTAQLDPLPVSHDRRVVEGDSLHHSTTTIYHELF